MLNDQLSSICTMTLISMRKTIPFAILPLILTMSACSNSDSVDPVSATDSTSLNGDLVDTDIAAEVDTDSGANTELNQGNTDSPVQPSSQARYRITLTATWSEATHPLNFPGDPHFSGLIGAVHNEQVRFWEPAQIASPGIQQMAETGAKTEMRIEVQAAIDSGFALALIDGGGIRTSPGNTSIEIDATRDYPQITVTSMLAPSPDWFVGLHNFSLLTDGEFIESATIDMTLYDSGSDSGVRYTSANQPTDPLSPIARVSSASEDAPFIDGMPGVGSIFIERLSVQ